MKNFLFAALITFSCGFTAKSQTGEALFDQGGKLYEEKKYPDAIAVFDKAEKLDYKTAELYILRGNCQTRLDKLDNALTDYTTATVVDPQSARAFFNRGIIYKTKSEFSKAIADFSTVLKIDKTYKSALSERGVIKMAALNDINGAISDLEEYLKLDTSNDEVYCFLGIAYGKKGDKIKGIDLVSKAIAINSSSADYYFYRAYILLDIEKNDEAMKDLNQAIALNDQYAEAYFERGNLYYRLKNQKAQLENYDKAISISPKEAKYYYWRGNANMKNKEAACGDFKTAESLGYQLPASAKALCGLNGRTYVVPN
jgi:tetratricopeptide (TPR) repeat protein